MMSLFGVSELVNELQYFSRLLNFLRRDADAYREHPVRRIGSNAAVNAIDYVSFSKSKERFVSGDDRGELWLWDAAKVNKVRQIGKHDKFVTSVSCSPCSKVVVSGSADYTAGLWDLRGENNEGKHCLLEGHQGYINGVDFSSDGCCVISGSDDRTVRLWSVETLKEITVLGEHQDFVMSVCSTEKPNIFVSVGRDKMVHVWDSKEPQKQVGSFKNDEEVLSVCVSGFSIAVGSLDGRIELRDLRDLTQSNKKLEGHSQPVICLDYSKENGLLSCSYDETVCYWNIPNSDCFQIKTSQYYALRKVPKSNRVLLGCANYGVEVYELMNETEEKNPLSSRSPQLQERQLRESFDKNQLLGSLAASVGEKAPKVEEQPQFTDGIGRASAVEVEGRSGSGKANLVEIDESGMAQVSLAISSEDILKEKLLAEGGFGRVFLGKCRGQRVAIKELKVALTHDSAVQKFKKEAAMMVQLRHHNLVSLVGICIEPGKYCIVMPFMEKGALYSALHNSSDKKLDDWSAKVQIALDMAQGLVFLHQHKPRILHRDLKSLNVLLDKKYTAKLADFGLSAVSVESKREEVRKGGPGTLRWKAPELFCSIPIYSTKSDSYAFGMTLWELASRELPFRDMDKAGIENDVRCGKKEKIGSDWPQDFAKIIEACWAQQAEERPEADLLVSSLEAIAVSSEGPPEISSSRPVIAMFSSQNFSSEPADSETFLRTRTGISPCIKMFSSSDG